MKTKGVPPRVEYVLEAQALKEARDDPRWRRSSPEILLHDGPECKRQDRAGRCGEQRAASPAAIFPGAGAARGAGSSGGLRFLAGLSRGGGTRGETVGARASAAGESHRFGQAEERPGRFPDPGASAALRSAAGVVEGGPGDASAAPASAAAGHAGAAAHALEEPGARGAASAGAALAGDRPVRAKGATVAGHGEPAGA